MRRVKRALLMILLPAAVLGGCGGGKTTTKTVTVLPTSSAASSSTTSGTSSTPTTTSATSTTSSTPATPGGAVFFQGVVGHGAQRPAQLELTADGTLYVSAVQWTSWGGQSATGSGTAHFHGCTPSCAQAQPHEAFVSIRMSGIRTCGAQQFYSALTLTLPSGAPLNPEFVQRSWSPC